MTDKEYKERLKEIRGKIETLLPKAYAIVSARLKSA